MKTMLDPFMKKTTDVKVLNYIEQLEYSKPIIIKKETIENEKDKCDKKLPI